MESAGWIGGTTDFQSYGLQLAGVFLLVQGLLGVFHSIWSERQAGIRRMQSVLIACALLTPVLTVLFSFFLGGSYLFVAFGLALGTAASLLNPVSAIGFLSMLLFLRIWEIHPEVTFFSYVPRGAAGMALVIWLLHRLFSKGLSVRVGAAAGLYLLFLIWLITSSFLLGRGSEGFNLVFTLFYPVSVLALIIYDMVRNRRDVQFLVASVSLGVSGILALSVLYTLLEIGAPWEAVRLQGVGLNGNSNDLAAIAVMALPFVGFAAFRKDYPRPVRFFSLLLVLFFLFCIWFTQSRGAMLAIFCSGLVYTLAFRNRQFRSKFAALALLLIPVVLYFGIFRAEGDLDGSSSSRWNYIVAGFRMVKSSPVLGVGIGQYPELYEMFTPAFEEWGERTAHSTWILVMSESGLPGLLIYLMLCLAVWKSAYRIRRIRPEYLLSLTGYGIAVSFLSHTYLLMPYLLMSLCLVASRVFEGEVEEQEAPIPEKPRQAPRVFKPHRMLPAPILILAALLPISARAELKATVELEKPVPVHEEIALLDSAKLSLSRGEAGAVLIRAEGEGCRKVTVQPPKSESAGAFTGVVNLYQAVSIRVRKLSFEGARYEAHLDPLLRLPEDGRVCGGEVWLLLEVEAGRGAAPANDYRGEIKVGEEQLPLHLSIWNMAMPEIPAVPFYTEYSPWWGAKGHGVQDESLFGALALVYRDELAQHRIQTLTTYVEMPTVSKGEAGPVLDLEEFPRRTDSFRSLNLGGRPVWSYVGFATPPVEELLRGDGAAYLEALQNSLPKIEKPGRTLIYAWDEPKRERWGELKAVLSLMQRTVPDAKLMVTTSYSPDLVPLVDIFVPLMDSVADPAQPGFENYRRLQEEFGKEFWWYVSCMSHGCEGREGSKMPDLVVERPSAYVRSIGWLSAKHRLDGFFYYLVNQMHQYYPERDPWETLWDFSGNGDGTLLYPGRPGEFGLKEHTAVPSLRLKLLRQAVNDAQYVDWMERLPSKPQWWEEGLQELLPSLNDWSREYQAYSQLRERAGQYLSKRSPSKG